MNGSQLPSEAFVVLIARHERRIRGYIATLVAFDQEAIDDLLQTTYLVAWRKLPGFRYEQPEPDEEAVRWMIAIARLETFNYLRQRKKRMPLSFSESLLNEIADVQEQDWDYFHARWRAFSGCVAKLDDSQKDLIRLRYGQSLSANEIGNRQGKKPNTVVATLSRIRKALDRCIQLTLKKEGFC